MARADAEHLAPSVWDDSFTGLKGPKIEWLTYGPLIGLLPLGINPLILPHQTHCSSFT